MEVKSTNCLYSSKNMHSHIYPYNSILPTSSPSEGEPSIHIGIVPQLYLPLLNFKSLPLYWLFLFRWLHVQISSHTVNQCGSQSVGQEPLWEVSEALSESPQGSFLYQLHICLRPDFSYLLQPIRFFLFTSTHCNRLDEEADMRIQPFFSKSNVRELCKNEKQYHFFH